MNKRDSRNVRPTSITGRHLAWRSGASSRDCTRSWQSLGAIPLPRGPIPKNASSTTLNHEVF